MIHNIVTGCKFLRDTYLRYERIITRFRSSFAFICITRLLRKNLTTCYRDFSLDSKIHGNFTANFCAFLNIQKIFIRFIPYIFNFCFENCQYYKHRGKITQ